MKHNLTDNLWIFALAAMIMAIAAGVTSNADDHKLGKELSKFVCNYKVEECSPKAKKDKECRKATSDYMSYTDEPRDAVRLEKYTEELLDEACVTATESLGGDEGRDDIGVQDEWARRCYINGIQYFRKYRLERKHAFEDREFAQKMEEFLMQNHHDCDRERGISPRSGLSTRQGDDKHETARSYALCMRNGLENRIFQIKVDTGEIQPPPGAESDGRSQH